jgi:hypothetical protein
MDNIYVQALIQWLFFFALVAIIFVPAFRFRKIALANNKKGWVFFLIGMGVGLVVLQVAKLAWWGLSQFQLNADYKHFLSIAIFVLAFGIIFLAITFFKRSVTEKDF